MSPATLEYIRSQSYQRYKTGPSRPDLKMPPLDNDENGSVTLVPGELYCRWRDLRGTLCPKTKRFNSHTALNSHLKEVHKLQVAARRRGNLNFYEDQNVQQWYTDMDAGRMPTWPLTQSEEATPDENGEQAVREPSRPVDAGDDLLVVPEQDNAQADRESSRPADAGDVLPASHDGAVPLREENPAQPSSVPARRDPSEPEEGRPQSSAVENPSTPVKEEPDCKSESGSDQEPSTSEAPFRMDLPWDASGSPDIGEMLRLCGKDDSFRCRYCQEKGRECPGTSSNDRCEIWSRFVPPSAYVAGGESGRSTVKEEIDEEDLILSRAFLG
ncbi:hypothetical protein ACHAPA_000363 [Fusarium lateritium]